MLALVTTSLAFAPASPSLSASRVCTSASPVMLNRRDALFAGAVAAAIPASAFADGSVSLVTLQKARLRYVDTFEQAPFSFQEPNSSYRFPRLSFPPMCCLTAMVRRFSASLMLTRTRSLQRQTPSSCMCLPWTALRERKSTRGSRVPTTSSLSRRCDAALRCRLAAAN